MSIQARIAPGWHVYSLTQPPGGPQRTRIELEASPDYRLAGDWTAQPLPTSRVDREIWVGLEIQEHADEVTWLVPIELAEGVDAASLEIRGTIDLQACKESCIPIKQEFVARLDAHSSDQPTIADAAEISPSIIAPLPEPTFQGAYQADGSEVHWRGHIEPAIVRPGDSARLVLTASPGANWHVYANSDRDDQPGSKPTLIALEHTTGLSAHRPSTVAPTETDDSIPEFGVMRYHPGEVTWTVALDVPADAPPGEYAIQGVVGFQACEKQDGVFGSCELPKGTRFQTVVHVGATSTPGERPLTFAAASYSEAAAAARERSERRGFAGDAPFAAVDPSSDGRQPTTPTSAEPRTSLWLILGASLLGGLILNVMPCVLPVIGLKIMAFAEQGGESRAHILGLNLAFSAGLIGVFILLATLASLASLGLGAESYGWGELYTLLWFKVAMTVLVFAMALSFLGVWELPIPGFAGSGTAARLATREGYTGAVCKGIFTTILATPCSGPFLGPAFGYTLAQPTWVTYLIFLFVGLGMALPYLMIGAFPGLIRWLPRPGAWMETFKQLLGFLLLGTVVYLFTTIAPEYFVATLALLVGVWFACWWIGRASLTASDSARRTAWIGGTATAAAIGWLAFSLLTPSEYELPWQPYSQAALAQARAEGNTVLVDFTADWCLTCKANLKFALNRPQVRDLVDKNGVVTLVADWTDGDPAIKQALEELGSRSIPLLAIYPPGLDSQPIVLPDLVTQNDVVAALREAGPSRGIESLATTPASGQVKLLD